MNLPDPAPGRAQLPIRVAVADDHQIVRASLRQYLNEQAGIQVVGECGSGRAALELARSLSMDVLVLDIDMPEQSGLDAMVRIRARAPGVSILVLTGHPAELYAVKVLRLGASAFLNKQCEPAQIVDAVRTIAGGRRYMPPELADLLARASIGQERRLPHQLLTEREFQVFLKLARGMRPGAIAAELSLSAKSVSAYRGRLLDKLGLNTNSELTHYALDKGLID